MVKNRLVTTSLREIKNSFPRFLSLLIMSFLGVFVFSGLKATAPAMMDSLDQYYKEANTYDIKLTSTLGFDNLDYFSDIEEIKDIELSNYNDTPFKGKNDKDYVIQIASVTSSLNKLDYDSTKKPNDYNYIKCGKTSTGKNKKSHNDHKFIATAVEAMIGAIYLINKNGNWFDEISTILKEWMTFE